MAATTGNPPTPATLSVWQKLSEVGLIFCIFLVVAGEPAPAVNEPHYLCRLKHAFDPSYCPGDLFLESHDAHVTFVYSFGWLTRLLSLEAVAWTGRVICWGMLAWAWLELSWLVAPKRWIASLSAVLVTLCITRWNFAGEWLVGGFEAKCLAYVFVFWALRACVLGRWNQVWIYLGIASAWHALVGGWSVLVLLGMWLVWWRREVSYRSMIPGLALGGAIAMLGIVPALLLSFGHDAQVASEAAQIYVFERLPHHLAPLHKPAEWIAERAIRFGLVLFVMVLAATVHARAIPSEEGKRSRAAKTIWGYAAGSMALAVIGLVIELVFWGNDAIAASLLRYYWFRLADVAVPLAMGLLVCSILAWMLDQRRAGAVALLVLLLSVGGWHLLQTTMQHTSDRIPAAAKLAPDRQGYADWLDVCHWCRTNTPSDTLFLTPRGANSFKWYAARAEVVTHKDVPQDAENLLEWQRRKAAVFRLPGEGKQPWVMSTAELGTDRLRELAAKYKFHYVLTRPSDARVEFPMVYRNPSFVVYKIEKATP